MSRASRGLDVLADAWGVSRREAEEILDGQIGSWVASRVDNAIDQPSRAAGRFGSGAGRPIGAGIKTGGAAIGLGTGAFAGATAYDSYTERQTAAEENAIDQRRADALAELLNDPTRTDEEKKALIRALGNADFFRDTDITPESWMEKLGLTQGSLNPVQWFGGGLTGAFVFVVIVWLIYKSQN